MQRAGVPRKVLTPLVAVLFCFLHTGNASLRYRIVAQRDLQDCLVCKLSMVDVQYEIPGQGPDKMYKCLTGNETEPESDDEDISHNIALPSDFIDEYHDDIAEGSTYICVTGGAAVHDEGSVPYIAIPNESEISVVEDYQFGAVQPASTGIRSILAIRVVTATEQPSSSKDAIEGAIFGTGFQPRLNSLVAQYDACSFYQLNFEKASVFVDGMVVDGVMDLFMPGSVAGRPLSIVENEVTSYLKTVLGGSSLSQFDHLMYCMPPGVTKGGATNWAAYAYVNGQRSVYNDKWCERLSGMMHEIGHNLGLAHSSEGSTEYGDQSGYMGYSYAAVDGPVMCFNGHKNYVLGWYSDKTLEVDPNFGPWLGRIAAFVDYDRANTFNGEYVIVKVGNLYLQYNRQKGFNSGTRERANKVTVTSGTGRSVRSYVLAGLGKGQLYSDGIIVYEVCELVSEYIDYALVSIYYAVGGTSICPGNTASPVTASPTVSPPVTSWPTISPPVTAAPTVSPPVTSWPTISPPVTESPTWTPVTISPSWTSPVTASPTATPTWTPVTASPTWTPPVTTSPSWTQPVTAAPSPPPSTPPPIAGAASIAPATVTAAPTTARPVTAAPIALASTPSPVTARPTSLAPTLQPVAAAAPASRPTTRPHARPRRYRRRRRHSTSTGFVHFRRPHKKVKKKKRTGRNTAMMIPKCNDSETETFLVNGVQRDCAWLRTRPDEMELSCIAGNPAYDECEETCGKCSDICEDNNGQPFFVNNRHQYRTCSWLESRPKWRTRLCVEGHDAWSICGETCNSCDTIA